LCEAGVSRVSWCRLGCRESLQDWAELLVARARERTYRIYACGAGGDRRRLVIATDSSAGS
jgi:hypothetical protein